MRHFALLLLVLAIGCGGSSAGGGHTGGQAGTSHPTGGAGGTAGARGGEGGAGVGGLPGGAGGLAGGAGGVAGGAGGLASGGVAGAGNGGSGGLAGTSGGLAGTSGRAGHGGVGGLGGAGPGGTAGSPNTAGSGGAPDVSTICPPPTAPPAVDACTGTHLCDPPDTHSPCRDIPPTNAATLSFTIWVEDRTLDSGGWRVTLPTHTPVTAGGHTYEDRGEGLVGSGANGIYGDLYVARDDQPQWTGFHLEGWPVFHGGGVWDWTATVTLSRPGSTPVSVGRHFTITRTGTSCPGTATYTFTADNPPRACGLGIDLLAITFPGS